MLVVLERSSTWPSPPPSPASVEIESRQGRQTIYLTIWASQGILRRIIRGFVCAAIDDGVSNPRDGVLVFSDLTLFAGIFGNLNIESER